MTLSTESREAEEFAVRLQAGADELARRLIAVYAPEPGWQEGLRAVGYELRRFLLEDPDRAREMVLVAPLGDDRAREIREQGIARLTALIDLGRSEAPEPEAISPALAALTAGAIYNRMYRALEAGPQELTIEMVRELLYTAIQPYLGRDAALAELRLPPPGD